MLEVLDDLQGVIRSKLRGVEGKVDVEDVMQDAAVAILTAYAQAPRTKAIWTAKSARRKAWCDSRRDHDWLVSGENPNQECKSDPLEAMILGEQIEGLEAGFAGMDANIEMAVKMRFYEDRTYDEIGQAFGCSGTWAAKMVKAGLETLRTAVGGDDE
jgi:DNA-directed RNA polymerase specialized sigma24 family protein